VSDFLSRLAARAVREQPRTLPSLPSASEAVQGSRPITREPAHEPPVARATPSAPAVRSEPPEPRVERSEPRDRPGSKTPSERIPERTVVHAAPPTIPRSTAEPLEADLLPAPSVPVAVAAPVLAAPIARRVVESRLERVHTVSTTVAADEPPVRVHIGRLEVRANLEQPAPTPRRREPQRPQGPTLSDYLRGRRSA